MQISYKILAGGLTIVLISPAHAVQWTTCRGGRTMCGNTYTVHSDATPENCYGTSGFSATFCVQDINNTYWEIHSCSGELTDASVNIDMSASASSTHCTAGYKLYPQQITIPGCTTYFTTCVRDYSGACDISTEGTWKKVANGYDRRCVETEDEYGDIYIQYEYRCRIGYWGVAQFNGSTYSGCNTPCPENAACPEGNGPFICLEGFYRNGNSCEQCPDMDNGTYGTVYGYSNMGASSVAECYLFSGTTGQDAKGSFTITQDCYYKP